MFRHFTHLIAMFVLIQADVFAMMIESHQKIWDKAHHNAFTDLGYFDHLFYCTFRESDSHAGGELGKIRIISSTDTQEWTSTALISLNGVDLRDPKLSQMPNGQLMLLMGGTLQDETGEAIAHNSYTSFSTDGKHWTTPTLSDKEGEWIWSLTWHHHIGYGASYHLTDIRDSKKPWLLTLFTTTDGLHFNHLAQLHVPDNPSEATIRFLPDDTAIILVRRNGNGWIGQSSPPYKDWKWFETSYRLGGPNFLILPNGEMWASSRRIHQKQNEQIYYTTVAKMGPSFYQPLLDLPSGDDCSYPGMVYHEGKLYISYYSSHEGKSIIYFAIVGINS